MFLAEGVCLQQIAWGDNWILGKHSGRRYSYPGRCCPVTMATDCKFLCSVVRGASQQAVQGRAPRFLVKSSRQTACVPLCACFMHRWSVDITPCPCVRLLRHTCSRHLRDESLAVTIRAMADWLHDIMRWDIYLCCFWTVQRRFLSSIRRVGFAI